MCGVTSCYGFAWRCTGPCRRVAATASATNGSATNGLPPMPPSLPAPTTARHLRSGRSKFVGGGSYALLVGGNPPNLLGDGGTAVSSLSEGRLAGRAPKELMALARWLLDEMDPAFMEVYALLHPPSQPTIQPPTTPQTQPPSGPQTQPPSGPPTQPPSGPPIYPPSRPPTHRRNYPTAAAPIRRLTRQLTRQLPRRRPSPTNCSSWPSSRSG